MSKKFVVDKSFEEIVPAYLEDVTAKMKQVETDLMNSDFKTILANAHQIKGTAGSFGFDELGEMLKELEGAAKVSDSDAVLSKSKSVLAYMELLEIEYED